MITVYHLSVSRSERIIWLMEELGEPYELVEFERVNGRSPREMQAIHPMNKSPTIRDGDLTLIESGAIVEYIVERYGRGRLRPDRASDDYGRYLQWLHFSEGSVLSVMVQAMFAGGMFSNSTTPDLEDRKAESERHLDFVENELNDRTYFLGEDFTAADLMMTYPLRVIHLVTDPAKYPNIARYVKHIEARPAFRKAMALAYPPAAA